MIEIQGKYNNALVFNDYVEPEAYNQILQMCNLEELKDTKIRIMSDVHAGAGCTIGTTIKMNYDSLINPYFVGVDIGCGISASILPKFNIELEVFDKIIKESVPSGFSIHNSLSKEADFIRDLNCYKFLNNIDRLKSSLGTLGGGNHFIEINENSKGVKYLMIHSGSRNLGFQVANYYNTLTNDNGFLNQEDSKLYLHDMKISQEFAFKNRKNILNIILKNSGLKLTSSIETIHNYIEFNNDNIILRKGAINSDEGNLLVIPLNMRDGCIIGEGKGNELWNSSAPHGAGRIMSRSKAKKELDLEEFKMEMEGIYSSCISQSTLDESPMAYKNKEEILNYIGDTIKIIEIVKPIYNFKA